MAQTISEAMMPNGTSFCGLWHSSAAVETESNPMYVKNTMAPPVTMPTRYTVVASFTDGFGQESVVQPVTVVPS